MNDTLKLLYDRFYTPLPMEEAEQEIDDCHRQLIERLEKPERKLVLRIIDTQNLIAEERSITELFSWLFTDVCDMFCLQNQLYQRGGVVSESLALLSSLQR